MSVVLHLFEGPYDTTTTHHGLHIHILHSTLLVRLYLLPFTSSKWSSSYSTHRGPLHTSHTLSYQSYIIWSLSYQSYIIWSLSYQSYIIWSLSYQSYIIWSLSYQSYIIWSLSYQSYIIWTLSCQSYTYASPAYLGPVCHVVARCCQWQGMSVVVAASSSACVSRTRLNTMGLIVAWHML